MNLVAVIGNVSKNPELTVTPSGRSSCTFTIAVSRSGGDQADFFNVTAFERQAEICSEYLALGRRIAVEGRLHSTSQSERVEIVATKVQLLGTPSRTVYAEVETLNLSTSNNE